MTEIWTDAAMDWHHQPRLRNHGPKYRNLDGSLSRRGLTSCATAGKQMREGVAVSGEAAVLSTMYALKLCRRPQHSLVCSDISYQRVVFWRLTPRFRSSLAAALSGKKAELGLAAEAGPAPAEAEHSGRGGHKSSSSGWIHSGMLSFRSIVLSVEYPCNSLSRTLLFFIQSLCGTVRYGTCSSLGTDLLCVSWVENDAWHCRCVPSGG